MNSVKTFKKGELIQKEGEKALFIYLIQSGSVSLQITRHKTTIELATLGSHQVIGEHALAGVAMHPHSATALVETKAIELPVEIVRTQIDQSSQLIKVLSKAFIDKLKVVMGDLRSVKLEKDNTPCPPDQTAKIFGALFHVVKTKAEVLENGDLRVSLPAIKQYAQRVFLESPKRLENAINVFVKLGTAKFEMVKNEEDPDAPLEIGFVVFSDLGLVERFFEFFQYYHFKGGKQELLKTDERVMLLVQTLVEIASGQPVDRNGSVRIDYSVALEKFKELNGYPLNGDNFANLEAKGLFVKRQGNEQGVSLQFELGEFDRTLKVWRVLREVERWNEKGLVDPNELIPDLRKAKVQSAQCPACKAPYAGSPKFCGECGEKLVLSSAA
jgi:hypothetical protein